MIIAQILHYIRPVDYYRGQSLGATRQAREETQGSSRQAKEVNSQILTETMARV